MGPWDESYKGCSVRRNGVRLDLTRACLLVWGKDVLSAMVIYPMIPSFCASLSELTLLETMHDDFPPSMVHA